MGLNIEKKSALCLGSAQVVGLSEVIPWSWIQRVENKWKMKLKFGKLVRDLEEK